MFFLLSKTVGYFCYPLTLFFVLMLLFLKWRHGRPRRAWGCFWTGLLLMYVCTTPWGASVLLAPLEQPYRHPAWPARADVILVLGGALDLGTSTPDYPEFADAADRFVYAMHLARRCPQATVVFAGGTANLFDTAKTEASILRQQAEMLGVAPERIRLDNRSRNTRENAVEAKRILDEVGGSTVVVVTSAFHMRRSLGCLRKAGIEAVPFGVDLRRQSSLRDPLGWVPEARYLGDCTSAIREYVGLLMYRLRGYI